MKQDFTVRQGALDGVEAFLGVAQHRNFRKAAIGLGVTPSAISQAVRALEARVGAALFIRTTRSVSLTEAGERFLLRAKPAFEELVAASEAARDLGQRPAGLLRLSVPRAVVPLILEPVIASFCRAYPDVVVEIAASAELIDIAAEGFDAGIRLGQFIAPDMVAVRLTPPFSLAVVGSPDYLRGRKPPELIDDLRDHACLRMRRSNGSIAPWQFAGGSKTVEAIVSGRPGRASRRFRSTGPRAGTPGCTGLRPSRSRCSDPSGRHSERRRCAWRPRSWPSSTALMRGGRQWCSKT